MCGYNLGCVFFRVFFCTRGFALFYNHGLYQIVSVTGFQLSAAEIKHSRKIFWGYHFRYALLGGAARLGYSRLVVLLIIHNRPKNADTSCTTAIV